MGMNEFGFDEEEHREREITISISRSDFRHLEFLVNGWYRETQFEEYMFSRLLAIDEVRELIAEMNIQLFNDEVEVVVKKQ